MESPPSQIIDDHPAYSVNCLLDVRRQGQGFQYPMDWEGYGPEEHSWVSRSLILDPQLLTDFHNQFPNKPDRTTGGIHWGELGYCQDLGF